VERTTGVPDLFFTIAVAFSSDVFEWRPIFDQHAEMQRAVGLINPRVYHSADSNKSEIVVADTEDRKRRSSRGIGRPQRGDEAGWGFGHPDNLFSRINRLSAPS